MDVVRYLSQKGCGRIFGLLPTAPLTDSRLVGPPHPLPTRVPLRTRPGSSPPSEKPIQPFRGQLSRWGGQGPPSAELEGAGAGARPLSQPGAPIQGGHPCRSWAAAEQDVAGAPASPGGVEASVCRLPLPEARHSPPPGETACRTGAGSDVCSGPRSPWCVISAASHVFSLSLFHWDAHASNQPRAAFHTHTHTHTHAHVACPPRAGSTDRCSIPALVSGC